MSSFPITIGLDNPDPLDKPADFGALVALLDELVRAEIEGSYVSSVVGAAVPSVDDQDKVWYRLDAKGRPIGTYHFYNGFWRREYDHRPGEIIAYKGNPTIDFQGTGHRGTVGGEWDGFQLCSGENGSPNFTNKFIVGAKMDDFAVGHALTYWQTTVAGTTQQESLGSSGMITLTDAETPRAAREEIKVGRWTADPTSVLYDPGSIYGFSMGPFIDVTGVINIPANEHILIPAEPAIPAIIFPTLPNYYALAYAIFVGYE